MGRIGKYLKTRDWKRVTTVSFGLSKISRNRERDDEINKRLVFEGWTVIRFWGDDIKKHTDECVKVVEETIFDNNLIEDTGLF